MAEDSHKLPQEVWEQVQLSHAFRNATEDDRARRLYDCLVKGRNRSRNEVLFVVTGRMVWDSAGPRTIRFDRGWLKDTPFHPDLRSPGEPPFLRSTENVFGGGLLVPDAPVEEPDECVTHVGRAAARIDHVVDTISFLTAVGLEWQPATLREVHYRPDIPPPPTYLNQERAIFDQLVPSPSVERMTSAAPSAAELEKFLGIVLRSVSELSGSDQTVAWRAIAWQAEANRLSVLSLGSIVHYFGAIELIAEHFYSGLQRGDPGRPNKEQRRAALLARMREANDRNVMSVAKQVRELSSPTARTKISLAARAILPEPDKFLSTVFDGGTKRAIYDMRNYIAHATPVSLEREFVAEIQARHREVSLLSQRFILAFIEHARRGEM